MPSHRSRTPLQLRMPLTGAALLATVLLTSSQISVPAVAAGADEPAPRAGGSAQTFTVNSTDLANGAKYIEFVVPECVTELAYMVDGAAGGASSIPGSSHYGRGGAGALRSGTVKVTGGEVLWLYPSVAGGDAPNSAALNGRGGAGGSGWRSGGNGSSHLDPGSVPSTDNPGGGGGGSSAITTSLGEQVVIAGGGGGGGGTGGDDATTSVMNTAHGGDGDQDGGNGVGFGSNVIAGNWGGTAGWFDSGIGGAGQVYISHPGGAGGGGGGAKGGGAGGLGAPGIAYGAGAGGGGTSMVASDRVSTGTLGDYGLSTSGVDTSGDGSVTIAWASCGSVLTLVGTKTAATGAKSPAAGWSHTVSATAGTVSPATGTLDSTGTLVSTITDTEASSITVTVTQEQRTGWLMQNWTDTSVDTPLAVCTVGGDGGDSLTVTNLSLSSYSITFPFPSSVTCVSNTVEANPQLAEEAMVTDTSTDTEYPDAVNSGATMEYHYDLKNTGNIPLTISIADPKVPGLVCAVSVLMPGVITSCSGTNIAVAD